MLLQQALELRPKIRLLADTVSFSPLLSHCCPIFDERRKSDSGLILRCMHNDIVCLAGYQLPFVPSMSDEMRLITSRNARFVVGALQA